jgi:hypothetical protein
MPRKTSRYALETFLRQLARTGNFALAADLAGLAKSGLYKRRARDRAFDEACDAALKSSPERGAREHGMPPACQRNARPPKAVEGAHLLTAPGDLAFSRYAGRPQRRRMPAGRLTGLGITNFFAALANTANIRLAARAVGIAPSSIHARRRTDPEFAAQLEAALEIAKTNIDCALIQAADRTFGADWIEEVDPDGPKMTIGQAIWFVSRRTR